ncbi:hypothetical protein [Spiroplasma alleghenense]|uniref:Uncharacterized protein n=1 Tax=Spiroplasma alleghenense TaxID=216931 RepID=A0A345Z4T0_9MOLU|nr:hypothetical protein [Spiroplasma alleghenense]AXK51609.1 hypothetical protein SALLE_v1c09390 [Spiroplasma alleghenense]
MGEDLPDSIRKKSKSMDFKFNYKDLKTDFYVFHKYTKESGGAQDNQKNDVIFSMQSAKSPYPCEKNFVVFYICDGEYYDEQKMNELNNHINGISNFYLIKSENLEKCLKKYYNYFNEY